MKDNIIFVNVSDLKTLNYDNDDSSWKSSSRLLGLNKADSKFNICLYELDTNNVSVEHIVTFIKLSEIANLFVLRNPFKMKKGFLPLMLDGDDIYFTDKEEFSLLDGEWAFDCVYKTQLNNGDKPMFDKYVPSIPQGWTRYVINPGNIRVGDLFAVVSKEISKITKFCSDHPQSNIEISYSDRYIKTELALIICLQFIKNLIATVQPSTYKVKIISASFNEPNANAEDHRRLADSFISDTNRDETGKKLINDINYEFESKPKEDLPHYRELFVKASKGGITHTLRIMPDAGLAHWGLDIQKCKAIRRYFGTNNGVDSEIPICSTTEQVYYVSKE